MGFGLWTLLDCAGQPSAVTFETVDQIKAHIASWDAGFDQGRVWFAPVTPTDGNYATIADLKFAGLSHMMGCMETDALRYAEPAGHA